MGFTQEDGKGGRSFAAPTMTAAQEAETARQIEADKIARNIHGLGEDMSALGATTRTGIEPQYTGMGGNIGGMGGGSPPSSPTPVSGPIYRADVPVTPGVVSQPQSTVNDIGALGINAGLSGVDPVGDSFYSGKPHSGPVTTPQPLPQPSDQVFAQSDEVWVRGPDGNMIKQTQFINVTGQPTPGAYGGPVTKYEPHVQIAGAISESPVGFYLPWELGSQQVSDLEAQRAAEQAKIALLSEEGDDPFGYTGYNPPASESPRAAGIRERLGSDLPPTGSWANVPGAGAGAYMSGVSDRLVTPTELGTQQREALEAVSDKGDIPGPVNILNPRSIGKRQVWELEQEKKGFLNSGFY